MNKMQMAHDMALELVKIKPSLSAWQIADRCFEYADAMQAEADEREHKHMFLNGGPCICGVTMQDVANKPGDINNWVELRGEEEWQPDWSQAPGGCLYWMVLESGDCIWMDGIYNRISESPSFNYQGNWQDSLRKRPQ